MFRFGEERGYIAEGSFFCRRQVSLAGEKHNVLTTFVLGAGVDEKVDPIVKTIFRPQ